MKLKGSIYRIQNGWVNRKVKSACQFRDQQYVQWITDPNNLVLKKQYNKSRNDANKAIQKSKNSNLKQEILCNKRDPKQLWHILNRITGRIKQSIDGVLIATFGKNGITEKNIANNFAQSFVGSVKSIWPNCSKPLLNKSKRESG